MAKAAEGQSDRVEKRLEGYIIVSTVFHYAAVNIVLKDTEQSDVPSKASKAVTYTVNKVRVQAPFHLLLSAV